MPWMRSPSEMLEPICCRGSRLANGSWKMICIRRRIGLELGPRQLRDVLAVEDDAPAGRLDEAQQDAADRGLAAAGLADQAERLAAPDREADVVDRPDLADLAVQHAAVKREELGQVA